MLVQSSEPSTITRRLQRVLVIDNNDVDRQLVRRLIGTQFELLEATNGEQGMALYRAESPNCVLLDHRLPDIDGMEFLDALVKEHATVVLLTRQGDEEVSLDAVRRGAQDYLKKNTLNEVMLKRVVRYAIERDRLNQELCQSLFDLKKSEQQFAELAAHIDHGLWIWSADSGQCIYQNPASDRIYGRNLAQMNAICWSDVIHPDDREAEIRRAEESKASKTEYDSCIRIVHPDGELRHIESSCYPLLDENGEIARIIGVCRDVTSRTRLEEELRLAQKLEAVGQLAAGVAHEINTPCQYVSDNIGFLADAFESLAPVLRGYCDVLTLAEKADKDDTDLQRLRKLAVDADLDYLLDEVPTSIKESRNGLDQISKIVRAMKTFSHPGDEMEAADLNNAISSTVTVARNEWKYVADMELGLDQDLPSVICIPSAINQVILNLIVNAAHAIGDVVGDQDGRKGKITINTSIDGDHAVMVISDNGCGMTREISDRIFDPFFTTKEVGKGTGQGLSIAHAVVTERHNGSISVESEPGEGTTFVLRLPLDGQGGGRREHAA